MAQLTDDCFAFGGRLLPLDEACAHIAARFACVAATETVTLADADGRTLAESAHAAVSVPPRDNSAVDGFAVHAADLMSDAPTRLPIVTRAAAGHPADQAVPRGAAARVLTGAVMPDGPDTVLMQEDCDASEPGFVRLNPGIEHGANRRDAGEDILAGALAVGAGTRLTPAHLALLAATGHARVAVRAPLRVALFSTGDELAEAGSATRPGQVYDANRPMLAALLRRRGARVTDGGILPDEADTIAEALGTAAAAHDLVLTSGGVSAGEEDHVRAAIERIGSLEFWRIGIKPGRPVALGAVAGTPVLGLPGNPVAALVTFFTVARPLLDSLAGATPRPLPRFPVTAAFAHRKRRDRREYLRVSLHPGPDGKLHATLFPKAGAGVITSLTGSDALLELPEASTALAIGDTAKAIPLGMIDG